MENNYILTKDGELYHYGVKGMRWGVRRASKQLSNATTKGDRDAAISKLKKHREKGSEKLAKLQSKTAKLEDRVEKSRMKYESKAPGMRQLAAKKRASSYGIVNSLLMPKPVTFLKRRKAAKLEAKAAGLEAKAMKAKVRLENNKKMIEAFETEIKNVDQTLANKGRRYING